MRKAKNGDKTVSDKFLNYSIEKLDGSKGQVKVKDIMDEFEYQFGYQIATPLVNMLTCCKLEYNEVRLGVTKFRTLDSKRQQARTKDSDTRDKGIAEFGLNTQHIPLLEGITFPPERRTG